MRSRRLLGGAAVSVVLSATLLTGCSTDTAADLCGATIKNGALSDTVTVNGGFGTQPRVTFAPDVTAASAQRTVVEAAEDRTSIADESSVVAINYALYDSGSGQLLEQSPGFSGQGDLSFFMVHGEPGLGALSDGLRCSAPGDRVVVVFSPEESEMFGAMPGSSLVALVDVHSVHPTRAEGAKKNLPTGFPGVVTDETGRPGVVVAPGAAPTSVRVASRIEGTGADVQPDQNIVAQVLSVGWKGELVANGWESGPQALGTEANPNHPTREQLDGYPVGSQVVILEPDGAGSATIHVVDIIGAA